jgi:DNA (cytosine-5)-methyltransferase 1
MNELALFAGAGGGILGGKLLGWRTVCAVEWDAYAASVLIARQNDGILPPFPIWDDVQTFDGKPWRGRVDVVSGGFPCQDISAAGKGAGIEGERSGMWKHMARIIGEVLPHFVFVENSPMLVGRGLAAVLADLAEMGYDARWGIVGAHHAAAPHKRDRIWIVAHADSGRRSQCNKEERGISESHAKCYDVADANGSGLKKQWRALADGAEHETAECGGWWSAEPHVGRMADGMAARVDRLRCIGNGQVPAVVRLAWETLTQDFYQP